MDSPDQLRQSLLNDIQSANSVDALEELRVSALGKKGRITEMMKGLGQMAAEERKAAGQALNALKDEIAEALDAKKSLMADADLDRRLMTEKLDVTLPVQPEGAGTVHPISQTIDEIIAIFGEMGFTVAEGPDIESDYYNFTALNVPEAHPARQMHDTFYFHPNAEGERLLLRTHTSPVQVRTMQAGGPPFRFIAPGRTYRCDSDQTHTPMFHQVEGLVVDESTHMGHLKWTLQAFLAAFFEIDNIAIRLRPSYFPFTEPSMEIDMQCRRDGNQLIVGEGDDWMEIGGSGMVHPTVLQHAGIDSEKYQGFAFGMGIDRLAMLKYGMPDLRAFFDADLRWLKHYGFVPLDVPSLSGGLSNKSLAGK